MQEGIGGAWYRGKIHEISTENGYLKYEAKIDTRTYTEEFIEGLVKRDRIIDPIEWSRAKPIVFHDASEFGDFIADDYDDSYHVFECPTCEMFTAELASHLSGKHEQDYCGIFDLDPAKHDAFSLDHHDPMGTPKRRRLCLNTRRRHGLRD